MGGADRRRAAAPLPLPSAAQRGAIEETVAVYGANPEVELLGWQVIDPAEFLREGQKADGIYIEFRYRAHDEDPGLRPGREVTVFGEDGTVLDSQDFGLMAHEPDSPGQEPRRQTDTRNQKGEAAMSATAEMGADRPPAAPDRKAIRAFLGRALADDALDDEVKLLLFDHVVEERLDRTTLIARLVREVAGLIDAATPADWEAVADDLIAEAREVLAALQDDGDATRRSDGAPAKRPPLRFIDHRRQHYAGRVPIAESGEFIGMDTAHGVRQIAGDDVIEVGVLCDFILHALRHEAIADVLIERMVFHARRGQLDAVGLAAVLPELIDDVLAVATKEDWTTIAEALIDAAHFDLPGGGAR